MSRPRKEDTEPRLTPDVGTENGVPNMPQNLTPPEPMTSNMIKNINSENAIAGFAKALGITEINVYPHKLELVEAKVGTDLLKDGKPPFIMIFEADGECAIQLAIELPDGTGAETNIQVNKVIRDTWGNELKKFKIASRGYSGCICAPAKRILKCNAKKIYLIY